MTGGALDAHVVIERHGFRLDAAIAAEPGETVALMGPSGAGKSTLLAAIAGLEATRAGHVRIDDAEVAGPRPVPPQRRGVVLLGQDPRLFPHLTALENIVFGLRAHAVDRVTARRDAEAWLRRVGLAGLGDRRPARLSGGQQQRVALARALATAPRVLLLDEPLTALDPETAGDIRTLLADQLQATHATTLIVTHDALDAASLAHRLVILESGTVSQHGPVREVLATPATRFGAAIAGTNRLLGTAESGRWVLRAGGERIALHAADDDSRAAAAHDGMALAAFVRPGAVELTPAEEPSSPPTPDAGEWTARVVRLEQTPGGARVHLDAPPLSADVPPDAVAAWGLVPGMRVRARVAARDVRLAPAEEAPATTTG
jgi:molybdate transport system ATP-binding protein